MPHLTALNTASWGLSGPFVALLGVAWYKVSQHASQTRVRTIQKTQAWYLKWYPLYVLIKLILESIIIALSLQFFNV